MLWILEPLLELWRKIVEVGLFNIATITVAVTVIVKLLNAKEKRGAYLWQKRAIEALLKDRGIDPDSLGTQDGSWITVQKNSKVLSRLLLAISNRENLLRRVNMKISKTWILALVTYYATEFLEKQYGVKIDEMGLSLIADILQYGLVGLVAWLNRKRLLPPQNVFDGPVPDPNKFIQG